MPRAKDKGTWDLVREFVPRVRRLGCTTQGIRDLYNTYTCTTDAISVFTEIAYYRTTTRLKRTANAAKLPRRDVTELV